MKNKPYTNKEGYLDLTYYHATKGLVKAENEVENRASKAVKLIKQLADLAGFEILNRIVLRDKRTGKEFR